MHRQHRFFTLLGLIPLVTVTLGGAPQEGSQEPLTIKTSTQEVVLDVVVRDSHGKIVKGLGQKDFEVLENGAPQEVRSFQFIQGRDALQEQNAGGNRAPAKLPANPLRAVNLVCIVFQNLDPYTKKNAIDAAREFLNVHFSPDTWIAVFSLDGDLTVLHAFTTNRAELLQAANHAFAGRTMDFVSSATEVMNATPNLVTIETASSGTPGTAGFSVSATQKITGGELNTLVNNDVTAGDDAASRAQRGDLAGQRRQFGGVEALRQMDQIVNLIGKLGTLPGRKSVLLCSPGLATNGDADLFKSVLTKANKADVTFYALDVNGLTENSNVAAANNAVGHVAALSSSQAQVDGGMGSGGANMDKMRQSDYLIQAVRTSDLQSSLRALSEGTGGFLIGGGNDYRKPFQKLVEDVETHYELVYHPSAAKMDGRLRSISVKMARPDLVAESRTGYYALPMLGGSTDLAPYEMTGLAALNVHTPPHTFDFRSAAYHFRPGAADSQGELSFEVPVASLAARAEPQAKRHQLHAAVFALVKDSDGQVVDKFSRDSPYEIPDENLSSAAKSDIMFSHPVSLAPGHYTMEVAALDREANRASTSKVEFDVPAAKGVGMSSIALVQRVDAVKGTVDKNEPFEFQAQPAEGRKITPELGSNLKADAHPYVYFVVYPDPAMTDKAKIQVEFRVGGQTLAKQTADLPAPDATGAVPMLIGAASKPGDCELRITALQGSSQAQEKLTYTIAAK